ncbi:probable disease resistance RPP8-like protein 2 [Fagus crenata]
MAIAIFENDHILQFSILALIVIYICVQLYAFFWFILIAIILCFLIYSIYIPFHLLEHKVKRIKKEYRLLCALSNDLADVSWAQIDIRSRQLWDSEINPEMTVILDEAEAAWMATTERVVFKTKLFLGNFEKCCSNRRQFAKRYILTLYDYSVQNTLFYEMKQLKKEIKHHFEKKKASKVDIYGKLERSRATIRSLQDRPIDEHKYINCKPQVCAGAALISSIAAKRDSDFRAWHGRENTAFMQNLEGLEVQSKTGMVWVEEANEIIGETQRAFETFIRRTERRFFIFSNQMARHKLKKDIKSIDAGFFDLFKQKERYGFKFIRRGPSKSVTPSPQKKENEIRDVTVLSNFTERKQYWLDQVPDSLTGEHDQVKSLFDQLGHLHLLYEKAKANEGVNNCREAWLDIMEFTAKGAEETIGAIIKNQAEKNNLFENTNYGDSLLQLTELLLGPYPNTLVIPGSNGIYEGRHELKLAEGRHEVKLPMEIERMKQVITRLDRSIKVYGIDVREESTSVVGLEEDIHGVLSRLITNSEPIVSIVGMRGIGKTTLAKMIFNHRAVSNHFHYRLWVSIPQNSFGNKLLKDVGKQVLGAPDSQEEQYEREYWIEKLHNFLWEKYLLVLDNISTKEAWDTLEAAFPKTTNGSKIMLTTRHNTVASHADQSSTQHLLRLRTKEESWGLFTQMVNLPPEFPPESEKNIKAKVVGRCGGLPLAIFRLGYLMSGKDVTEHNLLMALEKIGQYQKPWMEGVAIGELSDELRKCLSYTRLFPRDYEIPARRLVTSWVAEGLVQQNAPEPEDVAETNLSNLINRYMIQVLERKLNGNIKTCCLPNALREYCLQGESLPERLADQFDRGDASFNLIHGKDKDSSPSLPDYENLDSFLSFDPREGNKPGEDIWNFLHRGIASGCFLELKVLDLERVFRPILPNTIGNLINLRYLGLRWTYLEDIPPSIGNLTNLQTLDVKHTYISKLPGSIWKLKKLRHLYLNQSYQSKFVLPSGTTLKNLRTLWGVFVDEDSPLKNGLDRLTNLRKLNLAFQLKLSQQTALAEWILQLNHLQSLRLRSIDEMGEPLELQLKPLSSLKNLSSLYLFGKLKDPSIMNQLPESLTDLTLSASQLSDDPMPKLGELPKLSSETLEPRYSKKLGCA